MQDLTPLTPLTPIDRLLLTVKWEALPTPEPNEQGLPWATHRGFLTIRGCELECYILSDGNRIFTAESIEKFFGGKP